MKYMSNYWLYVLKSEHYPENTYGIMLTVKTAETIKKELSISHWESPSIILGYTIADYQGVKNRLDTFRSPNNRNFIEMEFSELKNKVESIIITKTPVTCQLGLLTFIGAHCNRMECCRAADLYKLYKKNGGIENMGRFTHLLQSVGIQKRRTKHGIILDNIIPKDPDIVEEWWKIRVKENEHKEYERPDQIWSHFQMYLHGANKEKEAVPEDWFWKRLNMLVDFQRIKMGKEGTVLVFPSLKICKSLIEMEE